MFKILGADGKEYGPVSLEQLRQWVREGRAGGQTQVQPAGAATWTPLRLLPEFAEQFAAPPAPIPGTPDAMPPVVRTIAFALFILAAVTALRLLANVLSFGRYAASGNFDPGFSYYFGWGMALLSLPARVVSGIGLLRGREWARRLAIWIGIVFALYGAWALALTIMMFSSRADFSYILTSPNFLFQQTWSLVIFAFNIVTAIFLSRPAVRAAFARKTPATV